MVGGTDQHSCCGIHSGKSRGRDPAVPILPDIKSKWSRDLQYILEFVEAVPLTFDGELRVIPMIPKSAAEGVLDVSGRI